MYVYSKKQLVHILDYKSWSQILDFHDPWVLEKIWGIEL